MRIGCCLPGGSFMPQGEAEVAQSTLQVLLDGDKAVMEAGFDYSETTVGMIMKLTEEELDQLVALKKEGKFHLEATNSFIPREYPIARDGRAPELVAYVEKAMSRLAKLGVEYVVFGSGAARRIPDDVDPEAGMAQIVEFLKMCQEMTEKYGVTVVIEPLNKEETNVINSVRDGAMIIMRNRLRGVKLLADSYHMFKEDEPMEDLARTGMILKHTHIAEVPERIYPGAHDGEHIRSFATALRKIDYSNRVTAECGWTNFGEEIKEAAAFMKEVFKMTLYFKARRDLVKEPVVIAAADLPEKVGSVKTADGRVFPAQKVEGGVLVLLDGKKDEEFELLLCEEVVGEGVKITDNGEDKLDIEIGGKLFTQYGYKGQFKPYLGPIIADNGDWYTRLDPTIKEHPHHRSVWIAVGDVNGIDFWNEPADCGEQHHQAFEKIECGNVASSFTATNVWTNKAGVPQIDEKRTITFYDQPADCRYIDIEVTFTSTYGDTTFGATKEAGPLGIRMNEQMRADHGGWFENSYGGVNEGECWGRAANWCDYHGEINGKTYGVAAFDNEDNERYPSTWHIRNYGLFAANNLYFKGGFVIKKGESVTYKHRVIFYEGKINTADRFVLYTKEKLNK